MCAAITYRSCWGRYEGPGAFGERPFRLLWAGQAVSAVGDGLFPIALAFAVVGLTGSAGDLGLVFAAVLVPRVCLMLVGGVWADRLPRQLVMLAADLLRCGTQALVAVLLLTGSTRLWQLLVLAALYGAGDAFFFPSVTGLVPETVHPERLQQANALLSLTRSASYVIGPAIGGALVATAGLGWAFAIDSATFAVSAGLLALMQRPPRRRAASRTSFLGDLRGGWHEVAARTWVWASIAKFALSNLAMGAVYVLGPFVAEESLGGASSWGLIGAASGAGSLVGGLVALRVRLRKPLAVGFLLTASSALEAAFLAKSLPTVVIAAAAALGFGTVAFSNALWFTTLQEQIPRQVLSRVSSYDWLGSIVFQPLGYLLVGPLAAGLGTSSTLVLSAALLASSSLAVACVPAVRAVTRAG